jgi:hypothetical protein
MIWENTASFRWYWTAENVPVVAGYAKRILQGAAFSSSNQLQGCRNARGMAFHPGANSPEAISIPM